MWRRRSLRFACQVTTSLISSLLVRCKRREPVAPSVPSLRLSQNGVAHCFASLALQRRVPVAPSVPSLRSSHDGVARCFASVALQSACACGAVGPFSFACHMTASLIASLLCVANGVCLWRRRSHRFARHKTALLVASLLLRCNRLVPVAPSVTSLRSSQDGVAHCFASLALNTACACGAVSPFASLVTRRRRLVLRFSCVANDVYLWRRRSLPFVRHRTASLVTSLLLRCKWRRRSIRFARHKTASLTASLLLRCKTAVGPFASLVTRRRRSLLRFPCVANGVCL
jgi:hypothetical protein